MARSARPVKFDKSKGSTMAEFELQIGKQIPEQRNSTTTSGTPISREWMQMQAGQAIRAGVPIEFKVHHADPRLLLWYAAAAVTGCLGWLFYFIFRALNYKT
jgi:hypothetical protein